MTQPAGRIIDLEDSIGSSDVIAEQLQEISKAVKRLTKGRLTEQGIIVLIRELLPRGNKLETRQIKDVLDAAANLDKFVRKKEASNG